MDQVKKAASIFFVVSTALGLMNPGLAVPGMVGMALASTPLAGVDPNLNPQGETPPQTTNNRTNNIPAEIEELSHSVFKLVNNNGISSGFLTEVPVWGVQRQVIVTAGHAVKGASSQPITIYTREGQRIGTAKVLFYNSSSKDGNISDFALLLPDQDLPYKPLEFVADKDLYDFNSAIQVAFPNTKFEEKEMSPDANAPLPDMPNLQFLRGRTKPGASGGPVFVEVSPNQYKVIGNSIGKPKKRKNNKFIAVHNLHWLDDFINGRPLNMFFPRNLFELENPQRIEFSVEPEETPAPTFDIYPSPEDDDFPFLDPTSYKFDKPYFPVSHFSNYNQANLFLMGNVDKKTNPLWLVQDIMGRVTNFLKYGTEGDIRAMRWFSQIVEENGLKGKYQLIDLEYPEFVSVVEEGLPTNVLNDIGEIKENNKYSPSSILEVYETTPITINGSIWTENDFGVNARFMADSPFKNKPITNEEWDEVLALMQDINNEGFIFDDFEHSVILRRNSQGKLIIGFVKFKYTDLLTDNYTDVIQMGKKFEYTGFKTNKYGVQTQPTVAVKQDVGNILKDVIRAELVVTERGNQVAVHAVWRLYNRNGKVVGYLKYGTEDEIIATKKVHKVISENKLVEKYGDDIDIQYAKIMAENADGLPKEILDGVYAEYDRIKKLIRDVDVRAKKLFILSPVDDDAFCWGDIGTDMQSILYAHVRLNNKPITSLEWERIFGFFSDLDRQNIRYDDIYNNLALKRKRDNKLVVIIKDFEDEGTPHMLYDLHRLGNTFNKYGIKERNFYIDNLMLDTGGTNLFPF